MEPKSVYSIDYWKMKQEVLLKAERDMVRHSLEG